MMIVGTGPESSIPIPESEWNFYTFGRLQVRIAQEHCILTV